MIVRVRLQALVAEIGVEATLDGSGRTHVPLADHPRAVAVLFQELGDGDIIIQQATGIGRAALRRGPGGDEVADAGFVLDAPDPARWYLRLPIDLALPDFDSPDEVLGDDLFSHLPEGEGGRRWRALMTEAQVLLHNHSWNQQRAAQGQQPINSLWFWGGGVMPVSVSTPHAQVRSRDALLQGLALAAGVAVDGEQAVDALVDLRQLRSLQQLGNDAIRPLLAALKRGELQRLVLDFEDGLQFQLDRGQRWQFWKKPRQLHDA